MQINRLSRAVADAARVRAGHRDEGPAGAADEGHAQRVRAASARRIRAALVRLARVDPFAVPAFELTRRSESSHEGVRRVELEFRSAARDGIRAVLLIPQAVAAPPPAVLVSPGRHAVLDQVAGLAPADYPDRAVAAHLADAGLAALTVDYGLDTGFAEAGLGGRDEAAVLASAFELSGQPLLGALIEDNLGALAWLRAQPEVDGARIGLFGHSLGGAVALHTALLADGAPPLCTAGHIGTYPILYTKSLGGSPLAVLPGILEHADLPDLYAALAPRALHLQYGTRDPNLLPADAAEAAESIRGAWRSASDPTGTVEVLELDMGHGTDTGLAAEFFVKTLGSAADPVDALVPPLKVRFDLAARREIADAVDESLQSGVLTLGPVLKWFEAEAEPWIGRPAAAVSSGSSALEIAYRAVGVAGRTVFVPVNTFFATAASATRAGARVEFVDMELDGLGMDPDALRAALDRHEDVAAVVLVHLGGVISPTVPRIRALCDERGIAVIEDAAHAFGSRLDGVWAGSFGRFGAFSLYPTKVLTSAEGGILAAEDPADLDLVLRLRDHGKAAFESPLHDCEGGNWRLSEVHAAVGLAHLRRFAEMTEERASLAAWYDEALSGINGLTAYQPPAALSSSWYKYIAYLPDGVDRVALKRRLRERHGIALAGEVYDRLLTDQPFFADGDRTRFPAARWFTERHVCLPLYPTLTRRQQERTVEALREELGG
ncbi:DegT/DnrJ/EryC1/StrS family aminotransferase [Actinospica durhamensis]|uniref:DegT/DnrJ/EryC1/StrS family aminotransferase n=1 Tax=Actinospica durhamensis TaxID=1508375 RepID=A0A941IPA7_9ACTN|nr:DegT/DnrJ/EryC1/StrS family aminotransferase [Actinospica durhamensis]MBR7834914.1 DegT/DnrJ/EryC1/StrS family aminotransferase [Actinospica durhamensis]